MIFIIKAGRPFFVQAGAQGFSIAPLFRFQYFVSGFCGYYAARIASISSVEYSPICLI